MIDELSLGLAPVVVEQLLETVRALAAAGTTIILVEQSVNVALTVAETAYFMEKGAIRFHGPTAELLERPDVLRSVFLEGAQQGLATAGRSLDGNGGPVVVHEGERTSASLTSAFEDRFKKLTNVFEPRVRGDLGFCINDPYVSYLPSVCPSSFVSPRAAARDLTGVVQGQGVEQNLQIPRCCLHRRLLERRFMNLFVQHIDRLSD
jgi:hypothetical protein